MDESTIVAVPPENLDRLESLWRALYEHHARLTPRLNDRRLPFEHSWRVRREAERGWLGSEPGSFVLAMEEGDHYLGYAFVRIRPNPSFASWRLSDPLAELATLVVDPGLRGRGIGSELLDAVEARLRDMGIVDLMIGVVATNVDAMRLYERRGAVPFVTELIQRVGPGQASPA